MFLGSVPERQVYRGRDAQLPHGCNRKEQFTSTHNGTATKRSITQLLCSLNVASLNVIVSNCKSFNT
jgi:hypothetical protein